MAKIIKQDYVVSGDLIFVAFVLLVVLTGWSMISNKVSNKELSVDIATLKEKVCWTEEQLIQQINLRSATYQKKIIEKE